MDISRHQQQQKLDIVSQQAQDAFEEQARRMHLDPDNIWIGGYTDYEWRHLRIIIDSYNIDPRNLNVLEFGCNVGASAIVYSLLGAKVSAIDVDDEYVTLARYNAKRYGADNIDFRCIPDTRTLPYPDAHFDLINCNSVLEYVAYNHLKDVQKELNRILKPGGKILISGTSSRLWPKEVHSGKWFTNYMPRQLIRAMDTNRAPQQGVTPWSIRYGFGPNYFNIDKFDRGSAFLQARRRMEPPRDTLPVQMMVGLSSILGIGPGMLGQTISCVLEKGQ